MSCHTMQCVQNIFNIKYMKLLTVCRSEVVAKLFSVLYHLPYMQDSFIAIRCCHPFEDGQL